jgi:hypothetical protein
MILLWALLSLLVVGPLFTWWLARRFFGKGKP